MSKARIVQSFSLATLFSMVAFGLSIPLPAKAQSLRDCVVKYQRDYGVSADEALRQCRRYGEESPGENRGQCISRATQTFSKGYNSAPAADKAGSFCLNGGNSSCLAESFTVFSKGYNSAPAADKASEACRR